MRRGLIALWLLCASLAAHAQLQRVSLDSIAPSTEPAAGYWRIEPEGAIFVCEPYAGRTGSYTLRLVSSPVLGVAPGTYFGAMTATAKKGVYQAELILDPSNFKRRAHTRNCTIEMNEEANRLIFKPYHNRLKVNLNRLMPYLFRVSLRQENTRPDDIDGAVRIDGADNPGGKIVIL